MSKKELYINDLEKPQKIKRQKKYKHIHTKC